MPPKTPPSRTKASKANADYTMHGSASEHCAICQFFLPSYHRCTKVQGVVSPNGWSRFFKKKEGL